MFLVMSDENIELCECCEISVAPAKCLLFVPDSHPLAVSGADLLPEC